MYSIIEKKLHQLIARTPLHIPPSYHARRAYSAALINCSDSFRNVFNSSAILTKYPYIFRLAAFSRWIAAFNFSTSSSSSLSGSVLVGCGVDDDMAAVGSLYLKKIRETGMLWTMDKSRPSKILRCNVYASHFHRRRVS